MYLRIGIKIAGDSNATKFSVSIGKSSKVVGIVNSLSNDLGHTS